MADVSCRLSSLLLKRLEEEKNYDSYNPKSTTVIIQEALAMYFLRKDLERGLPNTEVMLRNQPLEVKDCIPPDQVEYKGLIMPDMTIPLRPRPHLDNLKLPSQDIRPGPGAIGRLIAIGVDPKDVLMAKRAAAKGLEYSKELEQYFDLLNP